jgi:hypothetical protein
MPAAQASASSSSSTRIGIPTGSDILSSRAYTIEDSTNLTDWGVLTNLMNTNGTAEFNTGPTTAYLRYTPIISSSARLDNPVLILRAR